MSETMMQGHGGEEMSEKETRDRGGEEANEFAAQDPGGQETDGRIDGQAPDWDLSDGVFSEKWKDEKEARSQILALTAAYCKRFREGNVPFQPGDRIPYASRMYDREEMVSLVDSALEFWLTAGRYTEEFEKSLADYLGVRFASLVNSGSSANLLAFSALTSPLLGERRIRRGDEVITVAAGFPTTVTPILQYGAVPVFLDVELPSCNMDVSMLEEALSGRTKAVMAAHTLGNPFDLSAVKAFCEKHDLWLVEDNCDALGSSYTLQGEERLTGSFGDIGTSSFYPPHHMTMGEGGAVYTSNPLLNRIMRSIRDWGRDCWCPPGHDGTCGHRFDGQYGELPRGYDHKYVYSHFGYNLKATDMQAAIGCAQLKKLPGFTERRRHNFAFLKERLLEGGAEKDFLLPEAEARSNPSWFGFLMVVRQPGERERIVRFLEERGIQTRMLFAGNLLKHPCFDELRRSGEGYRTIGRLENTDRVMQDGFWVGLYPGMTDEKLSYMAEMILEAGRECANKGGLRG